jgi:hypothetical protein
MSELETKKAPEIRGLGLRLCRPSRDAAATSSSSEQLFSLRVLSWLRSSSM